MYWRRRDDCTGTELEIIFLKKFWVHCEKCVTTGADTILFIQRELTMQWAASMRQILNFILCTLTTYVLTWYWYLIIKHWLVLYNTCWIMSILDHHPLCYVLSWHVITEWNLWWCNFRGTSRHWSGEMKSFWINNIF